MEPVRVRPRSTKGFHRVLGRRARADADAALAELRSVLGGRTVFHVNSTAAGGGVAELLGALLPYELGAGIDVRWLVMDGSPEFFDVTKRIHNRLHENDGDGAELDDRARSAYAGHLAAQAVAVCRAVRKGDIAVLHDPQTAGLVAPLRQAGVRVIWRCHVGCDAPGALAHSAIGFLLPLVEPADGVVFSRRAHVWEGLAGASVAVIPPCIDVLSAKNRPMTSDERDQILSASGILRNGAAAAAVPAADLVEDQPVPHDAAVVTQVSRWDRLKDQLGVLRSFEGVDGAHLVLAGPNGVSDDPESAETFAAVCHAREQLPPQTRGRVHLARLAMDDLDASDVTINALQRRADVVVQKSLAEGFGLTVTEAMWKSRTIVASRVGGIQDQVVDGESGVLVDPDDLDAFARVTSELLHDPQRAAGMGSAARERVLGHFLPMQHFAHEAQLFERVLG